MELQPDGDGLWGHLSRQRQSLVLSYGEDAVKEGLELRRYMQGLPEVEKQLWSRKEDMRFLG